MAAGALSVKMICFMFLDLFSNLPASYKINSSFIDLLVSKDLKIS